MRVFVVHDARGNIRSVAVPAADVGDQLALEAPRGRFVSEIDVPDSDDSSPRDPLEQLRHVSERLKTQRVKRVRGHATLMARRSVKKR